jgi:hypothetical protein
MVAAAELLAFLPGITNSATSVTVATLLVAAIFALPGPDREMRPNQQRYP